jgi:hypothetical protein
MSLFFADKSRQISDNFDININNTRVFKVFIDNIMRDIKHAREDGEYSISFKLMDPYDIKYNKEEVIINIIRSLKEKRYNVNLKKEIFCSDILRISW